MNGAETWLRQAGGWRLMRWAAIAALLLAPLIAMQVTDQVAWTAGDFAAAAVLLVGAAAIYELVALKARGAMLRILVGARLVAAVTLIWAEGAVGIFPS